MHQTSHTKSFNETGQKRLKLRLGIHKRREWNRMEWNEMIIREWKGMKWNRMYLSKGKE